MVVLSLQPWENVVKERIGSGLHGWSFDSLSSIHTITNLIYSVESSAFQEIHSYIVNGITYGDGSHGVRSEFIGGDPEAGHGETPMTTIDFKMAGDI